MTSLEADPNQETEMRMFRAQRAAALIKDGLEPEDLDMIRAVGVYGSVAKGTANRDSDTDMFLVTQNARPSQGAALQTRITQLLESNNFHLGGGAGEISLGTVPHKLIEDYQRGDEISADKLMADLHDHAIVLWGDISLVPPESSSALEGE